MTTAPTDIAKHDFPHPVLTKLADNEVPTHKTLLKLHRELNANAMSVPSLLGGGQHGHLALVLSDANYVAQAGAGNAFVPPVHPGPPPVLAAGTTNAAIAAANLAHKTALNTFKIYVETEVALKKQLLEAVPDQFIDELQHVEYGYANVTTRTIIAHLDATYGTITQDELDDNDADLRRKWDLGQSIQALFKQVKDCRDFAAAAGDPISEAKAIRAMIANLEATGAFDDAIKDWKKRPTAEHTLANFRLDFTKADKDRRREKTSGEGGYAGAAASGSNPPSGTTPNQDTPLPGWKYCWTHGLNKTHSSNACNNKTDGHKNDATLDNMQGGKNTIQRRPGERNQFRRNNNNNNGGGNSNNANNNDAGNETNGTANQAAETPTR